MKDVTDDAFRGFLQALADSGRVRVVGSYAKGTANIGDHLSDVDFWVLKESEGMKEVIAIHERHDIAWDSVIIGAINTPRNPHYLPIPVECSYLFDCQTRRLIDVEIFGVAFKGYEQT